MKRFTDRRPECVETVRVKVGLWSVMGTVWALLVAGGAVADAPPKRAAPDPLAEVEACLERNVPKGAVVQELTFVQHDRHGGTMTCTGTLYQARFPHKDFPDGRRKLRLKFEKPPHVQGIEFVFHEREGCADGWVYRQGRPRRLPPCGDSRGAIPCSDFTVEDFAELYDLNDKPKRRRFADEVLGKAKCYVVEGYPQKKAAPAAAEPDAEKPNAEKAGAKPKRSRSKDRVEQLSAYDRIRTHVDQKTCLVLQEDGFEKEQLLKRLTTDPASIQKKGKIHWAAKLKMEDRTQKTHTDLLPEEPELDCKLAENVFDEKSMGRHVRIRCD